LSLYVVAYDVSHNSRRGRVARILLSFGIRAQESVFEIDATPAEIEEMRTRLGPLLGPRDRLGIYPVDERGDRVRAYWKETPVWGKAGVTL